MEDIVIQYHQRNHPPHRPDNAHLLAIQNQQMSHSCSASCSAVDDTKEVGTPISLHPQGATDSPLPLINANFLPGSLSQPMVRSAMYGVHPDNLDPSQLSFYAPTVCDIIGHARKVSHCNLAFLNSFPLCPQFNTKAGEYMNEAIVKRQS